MANSLAAWKGAEQSQQVLICRQAVSLAALSSFRTIYLNIDDKVSPPGLWRDTLALSADVQRHEKQRGRAEGVGGLGEALKCNGFCF